MFTKQALKNETIINQGSKEKTVYKIVSGTVGVYDRDDSGSRLLLTKGSDDAFPFFGEMAALCDEPRSATIVAESVVEYEVYTAEEFLELLKTDVNLVVEMTRMINSQYFKQVKRLSELNPEEYFASEEYACRTRDLFRIMPQLYYRKLISDIAELKAVTRNVAYMECETERMSAEEMKEQSFWD